jgi:hypothetical protein
MIRLLLSFVVSSTEVDYKNSIHENSIYQFGAQPIEEGSEKLSFSEYQNKVLLVVNVATL